MPTKAKKTKTKKTTKKGDVQIAGAGGSGKVKKANA